MADIGKNIVARILLFDRRDRAAGCVRVRRSEKDPESFSVSWVVDKNRVNDIHLFAMGEPFETSVMAEFDVIGGINDNNEAHAEMIKQAERLAEKHNLRPGKVVVATAVQPWPITFSYWF